MVEYMEKIQGVIRLKNPLQKHNLRKYKNNSTSAFSSNLTCFIFNIICGQPYEVFNKIIITPMRFHKVYRF